MYTVATYICSSVCMTHVNGNDSVVNVGELASSLDINYICMFPPSTDLTFIVLFIFSLSKRSYSRILLLCSSVKSFICRGMNVSLI